MYFLPQSDSCHAVLELIEGYYGNRRCCRTVINMGTAIPANVSLFRRVFQIREDVWTEIMEGVKTTFMVVYLIGVTIQCGKSVFHIICVNLIITLEIGTMSICTWCWGHTCICRKLALYRLTALKLITLVFPQDLNLIFEKCIVAWLNLEVDTLQTDIKPTSADFKTWVSNHIHI